MTSVAELLGAFFGPGNDLDETHPAVAGWLDQVTTAWPDFPLILPRRGGKVSSDDVRWYAMTASSRQARRVQEELTAWIGPTYGSQWTGRPAALDRNDP